MKDIAVYGAGGFGREIACLIENINQKDGKWNFIGFFDDGKKLGAMVSHFGPVLGGLSELNEYNSNIDIVMAIGNPQTVKKIVGNLSNKNISFPNIVAPDFEQVDPRTFKMGKGNIIQSHCFASCDVEIGDFNTFNGSITLSHDNKVGSFNSFMPGVRISGEVEIGNGNFFGVGSIILQQIKIGDNVKLGAGSVLMRKPKSGNLYIGNPAKIFKFE